MNLLANASVVLVHGAWADGSSWTNVIIALQRCGLNVTCAQIPLTSLTDDAAALSRAVERTPGAVLLAGHAYGGAVTGAVTNDRVKALVYIAALTPDEGETVAQLFYHDAPHPNAPRLAPDAHGYFWMPDEGFPAAFAHKATADQTRIMAAVQRPIAIQCIQEPAPAPTWKVKPSWYLIAKEDRMISPATQRFLAERMGARVRSEDTDHSPMVTEPDVVVEVIVDAACETLSP